MSVMLGKEILCTLLMLKLPSPIAAAGFSTGLLKMATAALLYWVSQAARIALFVRRSFAAPLVYIAWSVY